VKSRIGAGTFRANLASLEILIYKKRLPRIHQEKDDQDLGRQPEAG
jgi:hypothetical protein